MTYLRRSHNQRGDHMKVAGLVLSGLFLAPSAVCADGWVLWREIQGPPHNTWVIEAGAPDYAACKVMIEAIVAEHEARSSSYRPSPAMLPNVRYQFTRFDEQTQRWILNDGFRYVCLPGTITDPRAKTETR